MDKLTNYRANVDDAMKKVKNNIDYFDCFGEVYVTQKLKEYLDNIYFEMEKIRLLLLAKEEEYTEEVPTSENN
jgi:hypothetical protein